MSAGPDAPRLALDGWTPLPPGKIAAVVTCLDMRAPPPPRPGREPRGGSGQAPLALVPFAGSVADYRALYRAVGADWLWFSRLVMDEARLSAILADPRVEICVLTRDGEAAGLLELDRRVPGEVELAFFGLMRSEIGRGSGRWLMERAVEKAFSTPITRFWVHTCTLDHPRAVPFYVASGFTPYARAIEVADDPRLSGALPADAAPHCPLIAPGE
jgi:GNAT superfamily N-acetyltransferase